jgi:hypothetical protein
MGSYTPPPGQKTGSVRTAPAKTAAPAAAPQPADPALSPDVAPGEFTGSVAVPPALSATQAMSRLKIGEKKVPLGPRLSTIFGTIVLAAGIAFLVMRAPTRVTSMQLQKWAGLDSLMQEWGNPRMCGGSAGCLTIYLSTDKVSQKALEGGISLADDVAEKGIETVFVIGKDSAKNCVKMARSIRREVLFDPLGEWAAAMRIREIPYFVVATTTGEVKLRGSESPAAAAVVESLR